MFDNITVTNILFYKTNLTYKQARGLFIFDNKYIFELVWRFNFFYFYILEIFLKILKKNYLF
jgi:hypothetical protein